MRELVKKRIDEHTYEINQLNTTQSLKVLRKLTRILGEPIALMAASASGGEGSKKGAKKSGLLDKNLQPEIMAKAVKALIENIDNDDVLDLIKQLSSEGILCDHKQVDFDSHYEGKLPHLFKVLAAVLEVQYGNFLGALLGNLGTATSVKKVAEAAIRSV